MLLVLLLAALACGGAQPFPGQWRKGKGRGKGKGKATVLPPANQTAPCPPRGYSTHSQPPRKFEFPSRASLHSAGAAEHMSLSRLLSRVKVANYTIAFTSYAAGEPYLATQSLHVRTARQVAGIDLTFPWTKKELMATKWGQTVLRRFYGTFTKHGRWVWKPYVIWHALSLLKDGDFVIYLDASRFFKKGFEHSVIPLTNWLHANRRGNVDRSRLAFGMVPGLRLKERNRSRWKSCGPSQAAARLWLSHRLSFGA
ncbi:hypothetical protein T492DRAFT_424085 [Pavlovales sp. CCMP2436]|nr:hypothetical protein T492DRAFT_424085 [Pavlovales sp. CCMP2436]